MEFTFENSFPRAKCLNQAAEEAKEESPAPLPETLHFSAKPTATPPDFLLDCREYEPIARRKPNILEGCRSSEVDRVSHQENLMNRIVYDSISPHPTTSSGNYYTLTSPEDSTLIFESRFESGNLRRAIQVYEFEYDLILSPDSNNRKNAQ